MRVCFLLPGGGVSGGVRVVLGHASRLAAHGVDAEVLWTGDAEPVEGVRSRPVTEAAGERWDVAVATWWTTALELPRVAAHRRLVFAQSIDARFYASEEAAERLGASNAPALSDGFVAVGEGLARALRTRYPGSPVTVVRNGVDKATYAPRPVPRRDGPLKVLIEGAPGLAVKGVDAALEAVAAMNKPAITTLATLTQPESEAAADRVVSVDGAAAMAELYAEHDVLLKLSRHEGLSLPCLEAMHVGRPCVVTPFGGHRDFLRHGVNGLLVGYDDVAGTARQLDRLAGDPGLLERLGAGALEMAATWPSPEDSTAQLTAAMRAAVEREPADRADAAAALSAGVALIREELRRRETQAVGLCGEITFYKDGLAEATTKIDRLNQLVGELSESRDGLRAELDEVMESRAYRLSLRVRGLLGRDR